MVPRDQMHANHVLLCVPLIFDAKSLEITLIWAFFECRCNDPHSGLSQMRQLSAKNSEIMSWPDVVPHFTCHARTNDLLGLESGTECTSFFIALLFIAGEIQCSELAGIGLNTCLHHDNHIPPQQGLHVPPSTAGFLNEVVSLRDVVRTLQCRNGGSIGFPTRRSFKSNEIALNSSEKTRKAIPIE